MKKEFQRPVSGLIALLVDGDFERIELLTKGVRMPARQIKSAIESYGRKLLAPPENAFELMDVVEVTSATPQRWSITMPLWTEEEGRSDLSIELTLIKDNSGYVIELDDIHVL